MTSQSRRTFLEAAGALGVCALAPGKLGAEVSDSRMENAYRIRVEAARRARRRPRPECLTNGDEGGYPNWIGNFSKGLPHDAQGEVLPSAYQSLLTALERGRHSDFERIRLGKARRLVNPQAAFAFNLDGPDGREVALAAPPGFSSAETAAEMIELYWQAVTRDVPFHEYGTNPDVSAAAADLSSRQGFRGPRQNGVVTAATLFRNGAPGSLIGPYVSQFLWLDVPFGSLRVAQQIRAPRRHVDYLFTFPRWHAVQNGDGSGRNQFEAAPRYILSGRDLAEYVRRDFTYQALLGACLILLDMPRASDWGNPYTYSKTQSGFCTFGDAHVLDLVARVANTALKGAWFHKWLVHRRLRPEEFGGRVHLNRFGIRGYPIHRDVLESPALERTVGQTGTGLLTQAYPEGCPLHPAYPAGHAVVAGACTTVLKVFFDETTLIQEPVVPSPDGRALLRYDGPELTVGGELNKLAFNVAMGRNFAGIHWRSDAVEGLAFGEAVALSVLAEMKDCFNEPLGRFSLTCFDGRRTDV